MTGALGAVVFTFTECTVGCIDFTVTVGGRSATFRSDCRLDPFADILAWLERIIEGAPTCQAVVDEEGYSMAMRLQRTVDGTGYFWVFGVHGDVLIERNWDLEIIEVETCDLYVEAIVDPDQLVRAFYTRFREFAEGPLYKASEWAPLPLAQAIRDAFPDITPGDLLRMDARALRDLFWAAYPIYSVEFLSSKSDKERIRKFVDTVVDKGKEKPPDMVELPWYEFDVPDEFDQWGHDERSEFLEEILAENVHSWCGSDLRGLRSPKIEAWISRVSNHT